MAKSVDAENAKRTLAWGRFAIVLAAVVPLAILAGAAWLTYEAAAKHAQRELDEIAKSAEEYAARVMARNDVVMQQMLELLKDDDEAEIRAREAELHGVATAILIRFRDIRSLSVWGRDGRLLVSTLFFPVPQAIQRLDGDHLWGERLFRASKVRQRSGEAGGEVELGVSLSAFSEPFRKLTDGRSGRTISLVSAEGYIIGQWPSGVLGKIGIDAESGLLRRIAAGEPRGTLADGVFAAGDRRFAAFRKVREHALFVAVAEDSAAMLADWRRHVLLFGAILLPGTLALVLAAAVVLRRTRREIEARRRLAEESRQRRLAEESLRHARRLDALGQLAGGLAHDFNNLLAIVASSAELLAKALPGAAARPELASIERAAQRGTRLTRRLLAFFRRQAMQREVLGVAEVLDDVRELLRTTAGSGVVLNIDVQADTPAIEADAAELEIALINLVANARDAVRGAGRIDVEARRAPSGEVLISVSDNGEGMSAETLSRAFEPFFTTKPAGRGTGLGLSQVAGFCEQSGGTVKVASEPGVGTTVSLLLPAVAREARTALSARIILVQREADVASPLALLLRTNGCVVTPVVSAQEAERLIGAESTHFDAVLADASVGPETAAWVGRLRRRKPKLPVVVVGGRAGPLDAQQVMAALSDAISERRPSAPVH